MEPLRFPINFFNHFVWCPTESDDQKVHAHFICLKFSNELKMKLFRPDTYRDLPKEPLRSCLAAPSRHACLTALSQVDSHKLF